MMSVVQLTLGTSIGQVQLASRTAAAAQMRLLISMAATRASCRVQCAGSMERR